MYTAQKQQIKYQKKNICKKLIIKKKAILIFIPFLAFVAFSFRTLKFLSCFSVKKNFSVKDNFFNNVLIMPDKNNEYNNCGS